MAFERQRPPVVWIINHYTTVPSRDGAGHRHYRLAQELRGEDWLPVLFLASTAHPSGAQSLPWHTWRRVTAEGGVPTVMVRVPAYRHGVARLWNMVAFSLKLLTRRATSKVPKPDVIMGCTVHLLAAWSALRLARRLRVPFVFEIRDIWPETLIDLGALRASSPLAKATRWLSHHLCRNADLVVSPLPGVRSYLDQIGCGDVPFRWISNGVDLPETDEQRPSVEESGDVPFTLMYLGSHGNANGLRGLLDAFEIASTELPGPPLRLRLIGDGSQKQVLREYAATLSSADSIFFEDRIPKSDVHDRAREADALVVNMEDLPVYRFGISLNKLFDYLASGRPIVIGTSAMNNPVAEADAGVSVQAGDVRALAEGIRRMSELPAAERMEMGHRGAAHVRREYSFSTLAHHLSASLVEVTPGVEPVMEKSR